MTPAPLEEPEVPSRDQASIARIYDWLLGGQHHFEVDRIAAEKLIAQWPEVPAQARINRQLLGRAVRYLAAEADVRQFLDIGSGIPTMGNVHQIAQHLDPQARVVYVDNDDVAVAHSRVLLDGNEHATAIQADLRHPQEILDHPELRAMLDWSQPVGLLLVAVLHFFTDADDPYALVAHLRDALPDGSYLVVSHATLDDQPERISEALEEYARTTAATRLRSRAEVFGFFDGFDLVDPGLVRVPLWRPDHANDVGDHPESFPGYAGVGRRR